MNKKICIQGVFRSGTNFARTLFEWNYHCEAIYDAYGWKHGYVPILTNGSMLKSVNLPIVFVTKNPFSSLRSLYKYYRGAGRNMSAETGWKNFLRSRVIIYDHFQENSPEYRFANPIELWNNMNWNYFSVNKNFEYCCHLRYEDLNNDPLVTTSKLAKKLGLEKSYSKKIEFRVPVNIVRNMSDVSRFRDDDYLTTDEFNKKAYSYSSILKVYDVDDIKLVIEWLDKELVDKLGYRKELLLAKEIL